MHISIWGNVYSRLNRWPDAIAGSIKKAVSLKPDFVEAHFKLYQAYQHLGCFAPC